MKIYKTIKRNTIFLFVATVIITTIFSCRKTIECPKSGGTINYIGYDSTEIDTVRIYFYTKSTNFTTLRDSLLYTKQKNYFEYNGDTCSFNFSPLNDKNLTSSDNSKSEIFDLKVVNQFDNKIVLLKDFTFSINFKKSGGFDPGTNHCDSPINSYNQDGILFSDNSNIYINK
jgi:hypothetical protein